MSIRSVFVNASENGLKQVATRIELIPIAAVLPHGAARRRRLDPARVLALAESIRETELYHPITVAPLTDGVYPLIAGEHRLEACRCLKWSEIPARVMDADEIAQQLWQIDENLQRAELTELERGQHLADRKALYLARHPETAQHTAGGMAKAASDKLALAEQTPSFVENASAKTGLSERTIERSIHRVKAIIPEAQEAAAQVPEIAKSGVELDALAKLPAEEQVEAVEAVKAKRAKSVRKAITREQKRACPTKSDVWWSTMTETWKKGTRADQDRFLKWAQSSSERN